MITTRPQSREIGNEIEVETDTEEPQDPESVAEPK
jgi:hypothetical protein